MNCYQFDVGIQFPFQFNWNETNSKHFAVKCKNKQHFQIKTSVNYKNHFQVHGKISSKIRGDQDSMSEKIIFRTPEVPRRRRVELCDPEGDILFSGHENIGDHFISPGVLRRPKSAMDFSERPQNQASRTSEGYRWELLWQFVFCFYSPGGREDPRDRLTPSFCRAGFFYLLFSNSGKLFQFLSEVKFWSWSSNKESSVNTFWINFKVFPKT